MSAGSAGLVFFLSVGSFTGKSIFSLSTYVSFEPISGPSPHILVLYNLGITELKKITSLLLITQYLRLTQTVAAVLTSNDLAFIRLCIRPLP